MLTAALLMSAYPVVSANGSGFRTKLPVNHSLLIYPYGVAVSGSGDIYVTDSNNHRILKYSSEGAVLTEWGSAGSGAGQFQGPTGIAIDRDGNVYVADRHNHRIQIFDSNGLYLSQIGGVSLSYPYSLAIDNNSGHLYVADTDNDYIKKFDLHGTLVFQWGGQGSGNGQFDEPSAVAVDSSGNVYVADTNNNRIQKFTSAGGFVQQWGGRGSGNGQFSLPTGIAIDGSDLLYVTERGNERLQKFTSEGSFVAAWGSWGQGDGQFYNPFSVAIGPGSLVYVADTYNHRIQVFDSNGQFLKRLGSFGEGSGQMKGATAAAFDQNGNIYVADTNNYRIQKFSSDGSYLMEWGGFGSGDGQFKYPSGIAINDIGEVFVVDMHNNRVQRFDSNGRLTAKWGELGHGAGQFNEPNDIAIDNRGDVYVLERGNKRIQKFSSNGDFIGMFVENDGILAMPQAIAIDSHDRIYVTDIATNLVLQYNPNGDLLASWGGGGPGGVQFNNPVGVAVDAIGNIYVSENLSHRVQKLSPTGALLAQWGSQGIGEGQFRQLNKVTIDNDGHVWVADTGNARFQTLRAAAIPRTNVPTGTIISNNSAVTLNAVGATVYYTTDGSLPTLDSTSGTSTVISGQPGDTIVLRAVAVIDGMAVSPLMRAEYTIASPSIDPAAVSFDLNEAGTQHGDVNIDVIPNGFVLENVLKDSEVLASGTDYSYAGNTVTLKKSLLESLPNGAATIVFDFGAGGRLPLTVNIFDSTPVPDGPYLQQAIEGNAQASLSWSPVPGSTGYKVYRSVTASTYGVEIASVGGSVYDYTATELTNGTTYYFTVKGVNHQGESPRSNRVAATPFTVSDAPTNVTSVAGNGQATVSFVVPAFDGGRPISEYVVTASPGGGTARGSGGPITVPGLTNGTAYTFTVKAVNEAGEGIESGVSNSVIPIASGGVSPSIPSEEHSSFMGVAVSIGGKPVTAGTMFVKTTTSGSGVTSLAISLIQRKLEEQISKLGPGAEMLVEADKEADSAYVELGGLQLAYLSQQQAVLEFRTTTAAYRIPFQAIDIESLLKPFGDSGKLAELQIRIEIGAPTAEMNNQTGAAAVKQAVKTVVGTEVKPVIKAAVGTEVKPVVRAALKPALNTVVNPEVKPAVKSVLKAVVNPEVNPVVKSVLNAGVNLEVNPKVKSVLNGGVNPTVNPAVNESLASVGEPVNFSVRVIHGEKESTLSKFNRYIERRIVLPGDLASNPVTTMVVVERSGTVRHVPSKVVTMAGKRYVQALSQSATGTYAVIRNSVTFPDVDAPWAKAAVNELGSRLVLNGDDIGLFNPNREVTRAEFAAILGRALGLTAEPSVNSLFSDVKVEAWYSASVKAAYDNGLIAGFEDGTFLPDNKLTREQAMRILSSAMKLTGLKHKLSPKPVDESLQPFGDAGEAGKWARDAIADCVQAGIIEGRWGDKLAPKEAITRAEISVIVLKLMQKSEWIDG
ncbi:S-layer homology domain-containing protein [Paenibacillus sp. GCM10027627]